MGRMVIKLKDISERPFALVDKSLFGSSATFYTNKLSSLNTNSVGWIGN